MRMRFGVFHRRVSCQYRIGMAHTNCEATKVASQRIMRLLPDQQRNLVDPASSHMLVSKIKPCMSKPDSRRVVLIRYYTNCLRTVMLTHSTQRIACFGGDVSSEFLTYQLSTLGFSNWNENNLNPLSSINWRASLVPAAAVIPAPIAYIKVVAVKKLVVGFLHGRSGPPSGRTTAKASAKDVLIDQERKLGDRRRSDTVLVLTINYADWR
eukprot:gene250-biopygen261